MTEAIAAVLLLLLSPAAFGETPLPKRPKAFPPTGPVPEETQFNPIDFIIRNLQVSTPVGPLLFIPVTDTNKDMGVRYGIMPVWALRDKTGDGVAAVLAPSVQYNRFLKTTYTWRTYWFPDDRKLIVLRGSYSSVINREIFVRYYNPEFLDTKFRLNAEFHLFRDGKFSFYGFGPDSPEANQSNYSKYKVGSELTVDIPLGSNWFADLTHSHYHYELGDGPITRLPQLGATFPQLAIGGWRRFIGHGAALIYDSTDHPSLPRRGFYMQLSAQTTQRALASDFTYQAYGTRFKYYYNRSGGKYITAAHVLFEQQTGETPPFYAQTAVGETTGLRLMGDGRFTDRGRLVVNIEERIRVLRSPLLKFFSELEVSPFLDLATVFPGPGKLRMDALKPGPGVALRLLLRPQVVGTFDIAWGKESPNYILKVDYPF